ncbi:nuclear transport factor 2 family protein [Lentzea sp. HUAS12]|uniref:nuclear transport factor 2 family protein n=1 Tax=Lentzea sp. HUAS12 TaxID=2951806 RepID=UPI0020A00254|nr:nuclear transport factor 2 family protein [Lentzea sp. HUAS12]USX53510.1 nuclear transport factor 2 family protein [Lentzea sp. HUAS12]
MTATTGAAQTIADEYVRAWTSGDAEKALSFVADDVVCEAPSGRIEGIEGYRQFLAPFVGRMLKGEVVDVLGHDTRAVTVYAVDLPFVRNLHGTEYLTVTDGKISHVISVFDMSPMLRAAQS